MSALQRTGIKMFEDDPTTSRSGPDPREICTRLMDLRIAAAGRRGQSRFAAALGLAPSTYNYYEKGRVPPVHVLDLAARISGAPLIWLIRGEPATFDPKTLPPMKIASQQTAHPLHDGTPNLD